jgi:exopolysaccharide biosynthesis polyprenyl glycosylphosphotransferase
MNGLRRTIGCDLRTKSRERLSGVLEETLAERARKRPTTLRANGPSRLMASRIQFGKLGLSRSKNTAEIIRHSAPSPQSDVIGVAGGSEWLNSAGTNGHRSARPRERAIGGLWVQITYAMIDVVCVLVNGAIAFLLRFSSGHLHRLFVSGHLALTTDQPVGRYGGFLLLYVALILLFCQLQDLYRTPRGRPSSDETFAVIKAVSFATLLLTAFIYLSAVQIVPRSVVVTSLLLNVVALAAWRFAKRRIVIHRVESGIGTRNAVIIGAGKVGQALARQLEENKLLGYRFKGFLDENHSNDPRMLGKIENLSRVAKAEFVDEVFITIPSERELVKRIAVEARQNRLDVKVVPELYDGLAWNASLRYIGDFPVMEIHWRAIPNLGLFVKRAFDTIFSSLMLVLCLPVLAVLAIWIKLDSPGSVFYESHRVGKKGRVFTCYKLRTMVSNADDLKESLRDRNERDGPFFKIENDPRITRSGKFLRRYSLDEVPQLWNVLKGDMSLVGPRPHPIDDFERYSLDHLRRLDVKPGLTGLWQVTARRNPSFETNLELDLEYIENWSLSLDIQILLRTIPEVFRASGS